MMDQLSYLLFQPVHHNCAICAILSVDCAYKRSLAANEVTAAGFLSLPLWSFNHISDAIYPYIYIMF